MIASQLEGMSRVDSSMPTGWMKRHDAKNAKLVLDQIRNQYNVPSWRLGVSLFP